MKKVFTLFEGEERFAVKLTVLFLSVVFVLGLVSYNAALGSDPYGIVHFARDLSRGRFFSDFPVYNWIRSDWPPDQMYFVLHGNYILKGTRMFCKYPIGYPLVMALSIRCFGESSVFSLNIFILLLLLWFQFKLAGEMFRSSRFRPLLAALGPMLLLLLVEKVWSTAIKPVADLSALMFFVMGLFLGVRALRATPRIGWGHLALGAFCLGFSGSVRLPNVLVAAPAGAYLLVKTAGKVRTARLLAVLLVAALGFALGVLPALVQNYLSMGDPLRPPRPEIRGVTKLKLEGGKGPPPWWPGFLITTFPDTAEFFWNLYGPFLLGLMVLGVIAGRRSPEIVILGLGTPLLFIVFYSMWVHFMARYMLVAQPFLVLLCLSGIGALFEREGWARAVRWVGPAVLAADFMMRQHQTRVTGVWNTGVLILGIALWLTVAWGAGRLPSPLRLSGLSLVVFGLVLIHLSPSFLSFAQTFQLSETKRFARDIERVAPKGSVIFATKPVSQYIALFTNCFSIRPYEIDRLGVDFREGCLRLLKQAAGLYFVDSAGGRIDAERYKEPLERHFSLKPLAGLRAADYHLREQFGKEVCTLFQIVPWSEETVEIPLAPPGPGADALVTLNAREIWREGGGRQWVKLTLDGTVLSAALRNGINYLFLPAAILRNPSPRLVISSDRPLPPQMDCRIQNAWQDYEIDLGHQSKEPDYLYASGFIPHWKAEKYSRRLMWNLPLRATIPTPVLPETELIVGLRIRNGRKTPRPVTLSVALNGEPVYDLDLSRVGDWEEVKFKLPASLISSDQSDLQLTARPRDGYLVPDGDEWYGALALDRIRVKRWARKAVLPVLEPGYYFLAFTARLLPNLSAPPESFSVVLNGRVLEDNAREGVLRFLLSPEWVGAPGLELALESDRNAFLIESRPFFLNCGSGIAIDVGSPGDWPFIGEGWHQREIYHGQTPVRWTGPTAAGFIPLPLSPGSPPRLLLETVAGRPPASYLPGGDIRAIVDGHDLGALPLEPGRTVYEWTLSRPVTEPHVGAITIISSPWSPKQFGDSGDERELGVMVDRIEVKGYVGDNK